MASWLIDARVSAIRRKGRWERNARSDARPGLSEMRPLVERPSSPVCLHVYTGACTAETQRDKVNSNRTRHCLNWQTPSPDTTE